MTDKTSNDNKGFTWIYIGLALLVLYPLSIGPLVWLNHNGYLANEVKWVVEFFTCHWDSLLTVTSNSTLCLSGITRYGNSNTQSCFSDYFHRDWKKNILGDKKMGLFDFLFAGRANANIKELPDSLWMSQQAKYQGVREEVKSRLNSDSVAILLIAHFTDTMEQINNIAAEIEGDIPVVSVLAENLSVDIASKLNVDETETIDFIVAELHPLYSVDETLTQFARQLPCKCRIARHLAIDDPLIELFAGDWVKNMLEMMGVKADESIKSRMVIRRIRDVQKKVEAQATGNTEADSAVEWLEENLPNKLKK
ncbi:MAG: hypothetical protein JKY95_18915 [Planctomycetaceae bacterium]|nr:hypothetical protein [Planctomycetaceae bacterium]